MTDQNFDRRRAMLGAGVIAAGAVAIGASPARAQADSDWDPAMEPQDAWMEKAGTRHRMIFDTASPTQAMASFGYANNVFYANGIGYGLKPEQQGMIIVLRHGSTPFGYNDAMWKKYGKLFAKQMKLTGEDAIRAIGANPMLLPDPDVPPPPKGMEFANEGTVSALAAKGTRFAICSLATQGIAGGLAKAVKGDANAINEELRANLVPGGIMVAAGIVAVNRAQEHGYTLAVIVPD